MGHSFSNELEWPLTKSKWTHFFASPKWRNPLSFLVGYSNTLGLVGYLCSVGCEYNITSQIYPKLPANPVQDGFSLMFLSVIVIARDGNWTPSNGTIYGVFLVTIFCHAVLATTLQRIMNKLQTVWLSFSSLCLVAKKL